ncbi:MAG: hypothetical protein JKY53_06355 [Flavobacteriales bacterium]|nr:hypothetical protein [Flavobacteriales bacterium]
MKRVIYILLFLVSVVSVTAQPYGNEWINYSQQYLKFQVASDGVHKITYSDLQNISSINIDTVNPTTIQVWGRGEQQRIHIEDVNGNGVFELNDYIEFYAQANDGWFDSLLYDFPESQVNPYFSLYNDLAAYFITFGPAGTSLRYNEVTAAGITSPDDYFLEEVVAFSAQEHWQGEYQGGGSKHDVEYTKGEGWFYTYYGATSSKKINILTPSISGGSSAPDAVIETQYAGVNNPTTTGMHHVEIFYNSETSPSHSNSFAGFDMIKTSFSIPKSQISSTTDIIFANGSSVDPDSKSAVAYVKLIYPRTYSSVSSSAHMFRIPSTGTTHQIQLSSFSNSFNKVFVYDFENNTRTTISNSSVEFTLPPGSERNVFVFSSESANFDTPIDLKMAGDNGFFRDYLVGNPDSVFIIVTGKAIKNEATEYAEYRASPYGGKHDTIVAIIDELYDQFAYGIHKHPLSIRGFSDYLLDNPSTPPSNLFLIGKSIVYKSSRGNSAAYSQNMVPTIGYPATDNLFTAGLNGTKYEAAIPTGRLAALNGSEVSLYLDKVKELEANQHNTTDISIAGKEWMKQIIHFGGGNGVTQQGQFAGYLEGFASTIEDTLFGGYVNAYYKNSSDVIQSSEYSDIGDWITYGSSMITFFGHSNAQGFDVSLDDPSIYDNQGKYPLFNAFGCQSGNIHIYVDNAAQARTTSEEFILIANRGAIGFFASVDAGIATRMNQYGKIYYKKIAADNYGESIGEIIKATVKEYQIQAGIGTVDLVKSTCMEMSLHGDPAMKINPHKLPDYAIEPSSVSFTPEEISTDLTTFTLNIDIKNLGRAVNDSVKIFVERFINGESASITEDILPPIHYNYVYKLELPTDPEQGAGTNTFNIWVNEGQPLEGTQPEITTLNNRLFSDNQPSVYISSNDIIPIFPYNYAVVGNSDITLKASTADLFAPSRTYRFQIDTTDTYLNPVDDITITQSGGVVSWKPNLGTIKDSTVFFWRCSPSDDLTKWKEHSFQYIGGQTGWGQDNFFQFKNDEFWVLNHNRPDVKFEFDTLTKYVSCQTISNANNPTERYNTYFRVDGVKIKSDVCFSTPAMYVAVFDSLTLEPWEEYYVDAQGVSHHADRQFDNRYDNLLCWPPGQSKPIRVFIFPTNSAFRIQAFANMITNEVPDNNYILVYTAVTGNFQDASVWDSTSFAAIESFGFDKLSTNGVLKPGVSGDVPYIFFAKKGDNSKRKDLIGLSNETISLTGLQMQSVLPQGYVESTLIGPAVAWETLSWKHVADETGNQDSVNLTIYVQDINGEDSLAQSYLDQPSGEINLDSVVDAKKFPYIKLRTHIYDKTLITSGQLERWHVLYDGIPEVALDPHSFFTFVDDTLQEGQDLEISIAIENVSHYDMDTLRVSYSITKDGTTIPITYTKEDPLLSLEQLVDTISYQTLGVKPGINTLWIEVNPEDERWQLEQYHFNNIARKTFYVERDITNPLLDVTFDGIHILDGDIVSPTPTIIMELKDENPYIAIDDTSSFDLYIADPEGNQTLLSFNGNDPVIFTEATLPDNKAQVEYTPTFKTDGVYTLSVQGKDGSGNNAGDFNYNISFEVINKSTISEIMNYPNPFSTSTRFVFVLTGSKIPDQFKIQILTVAGTVVREITQDELGPINIGRNISEYAWNGTDEFGDPLANGVYLYRVITKIDNQDIEHRSTGADEYFHKGFGKMYLMR